MFNSLPERFKRPFVISAANPIFLALVVVILIGIFIPLISFEKKVQDSIFQTKDLVFTTPSDKARFEELINLGLSTKDKGQVSNYLITAFLSLSSEYNSNPSPDKRQTLSKLADYLNKNFPDKAKRANVSVPCKEESCGAIFSYSPELSAIKNQVNATPKIDQQIKNVINLNLENTALAAGSNNPVGQFNSLSAAFYNLKIGWQNTKDKNIKESAEQILALMKQLDSTRYQLTANSGVFELK